MSLIVTVSTIVECLRTDYNILGDKKITPSQLLTKVVNLVLCGIDLIRCPDDDQLRIETHRDIMYLSI